MLIPGSPTHTYTYPAPTVDSSKTTSTTTSITLAWRAGTAAAASYNIYGKREAGSRDLNETYAFLANTRGTWQLHARACPPTSRPDVPTSHLQPCVLRVCVYAALSYNASNLAAGTTYAFQVYNVDGSGNENNYFQFSVRTVAASTTIISTLPPDRTLRAAPAQGAAPRERWHRTHPAPCACARVSMLAHAHHAEIGVSGALVGGIAAAVIILFVLLIVAFVVNRRNLQNKQKKLLEEYSSQLQMVRETHETLTGTSAIQENKAGKSDPPLPSTPPCRREY